VDRRLGLDLRQLEGDVLSAGPGLAAHYRLAYASRRFNSVEINASFYGLLTPDIYRKWYQETPRGFRSARSSGSSGRARPSTPSGWSASSDCFPRDTHAAARLARAHDRSLDGRTWTREDRPRRVLHVLEVRDRSYHVPELASLARRYGVALVVSDSGDGSRIEEVYSDFVYVRLHGRREPTPVATGGSRSIGGPTESGCGVPAGSRPMRTASARLMSHDVRAVTCTSTSTTINTLTRAVTR
jgi:hypothetical protein